MVNSTSTFGTSAIILNLGNDILADLTNKWNWKLRVDLWDHDDVHSFAEYSSFRVSDASDKYRLTVGGYTGTAGERLGN